MAAGATGIRAGRAYVELGTKDATFAKGLDNAGKKLKAFGSAVSTLGKSMLAIGVAIRAPLIASAKLFADLGSQFHDMSQRTGTSTEALSQLAYAAEQSGADVESLEVGLKKMQKFLVASAKAGSEEAGKLSKLGLSLEQLKRLSPDKQFEAIAESINKIKDPAERAATAMAIFGKGGTSLLPMMSEGAKGIEQMRQAADDLGLTVSTESASIADELGDAFGDIIKQCKAAAYAIGGVVGPAMLDFIGKAKKVIKTAIDWINKNKELIMAVSGFGSALMIAGFAIMGFGAAISGVGMMLGKVAAIIGGIKAALFFLTSPLGLVTFAIGAAGAGFLLFTEKGKSLVSYLTGAFGDLWKSASEVFGEIGKALSKGDISGAAEILWAALKVVWAEGVAYLTEAWVAFKEKWLGELNGIKEGFGVVVDAVVGLWKMQMSILSEIWNAVVTAVTAGFRLLGVSGGESATTVGEAWDAGIGFVIDSISTLRQAWAGTVAAMGVIWNELMGTIQKGWAIVKELLMEDFDVDAAFKQIDENTKSKNDSVTSDLSDKLKGINKDRADAKARFTGKGSGEKEADRQSVADASGAAAKARQDYADSLDRIKQRNAPGEKPKAAAKEAKPDRIRDMMKSADDKLAAVDVDQEEKQSSGSSAGTFNAAAVLGLQSGGAMDKVAANTARTNDLLDEVVGNTKIKTDDT